MGNLWGKMTGKRSSRVRNRSNSEDQDLPIPRRPPVQPTGKSSHSKLFHGKSSILNIRASNNNNSEYKSHNYSDKIPSQYQQTTRIVKSDQQQQQPQTRSFMNKIRGREANTNLRQLKNENRKDIFSLLNKNTTFILQRHATSCANIINKGFKTGSTSNITFGKSRLVAEIAPDSMLSSIGIDECNQVHDYLTNVGTEIIQLDKFEHLFCCSELIRTQQTMFLSYFELIHSKNIQIMILPWLNEERAIDTFGVVNKDNLTITLAETKLRWGNFILNTFKDNEPIISKYSDWNNVFYLPDFIYRNPKGPEATFDKRVDLEKLYKIKMEEIQ